MLLCPAAVATSAAAVLLIAIWQRNKSSSSLMMLSTSARTPLPQQSAASASISPHRPLYSQHRLRPTTDAAVRIASTRSLKCSSSSASMWDAHWRQSWSQQRHPNSKLAAAASSEMSPVLPRRAGSCRLHPAGRWGQGRLLVQASAVRPPVPATARRPGFYSQVRTLSVLFMK